MAKHDTAGADPQMPCLGRDQGHHDLGGAAGEAWRAVVLGEPVAVIAERVDMAGEGDRLPPRLARGNTLPHRRLSEDARLPPPHNLKARYGDCPTRCLQIRRV